MNACHRSISTPQLGFDFLSAKPAEAFVNKPGKHSHMDLHAMSPVGLSASDALALMVVEDRTLGLGITNWRILIESAINTGHTELYVSDGGNQGLRKPGLRFGPIARMPGVGPEYVKRYLLGKQLAKAAQKSDPVKSGRVTAEDGVKVECTLGGGTFTFNFYDARKHAGTLDICLADLPLSSSPAAEDNRIQQEYLSARILSAVPDLGSPLALAAGALKSLSVALKVLEK